MDKGRISSIKDITKSVIKDLTKKKQTKADRVRTAWKRSVAKRFYKHTQPASFRRKRLVIDVDSSSWLYELTIHKEKIKARLKRELKDDFKEVRFRIGQLENEEE